MNQQYLIQELRRNQEIYQAQLAGVSEAETTWRPQPEKWCLLEIICHLYDEEREDFRYRVGHVLEHPEKPMPSIDPVGWVSSRKYMEQDFTQKLTDFLAERTASVEWLQNLNAPAWENAYQHQHFGAMSGNYFLANWVQHDYIHIRQILRLRQAYLQELSGVNLKYAGNW